MTSKTLTWIVSDLSESVQFEDLISSLIKKGYNMTFVLINMQGTPFSEFCLSKTSLVTLLEVRSRLDYLKGIYSCFIHFRRFRTHIVHVHLLKANVIGLTAAYLYQIPVRIMTRHHSDFHHVYAKKGVIVDRILNRLSTKIVAISKATASILIDKEKVSSHKVVLVPHGFDFKRLSISKGNSSGTNALVIGVVSRFIEWKGIQYTIRAFKDVIQHHPNAVLRLYGGNGSYSHQIEQLLSELPERNWEYRGFCSDMKKAFAEMTVFVHVPITPTIEAYGQTYIEAAAMEVPSVLTLSGIAHEFVVDKKNALVVSYKDSEAISHAIIRLIADPGIADQLGKQARKDVESFFSVEKQVIRLLDLYQ